MLLKALNLGLLIPHMIFKQYLLLKNLLFFNIFF